MIVFANTTLIGVYSDAEGSKKPYYLQYGRTYDIPESLDFMLKTVINPKGTTFQRENKQVRPFNKKTDCPVIFELDPSKNDKHEKDFQDWCEEQRRKEKTKLNLFWI